jgi:hypothetical protein
MRKFLLHLVLICATILAVPAWAENTRQTVRFPSGSTGTTVTGALRGQDVADYVLNASAGQRMVVTMNADRATTYFNVIPPGGTGTVLFNGSVYGRSFSATLPRTGAYIIRVYQMGSAATTSRRTQFTLNMSITGRTTTQNPSITITLSPSATVTVTPTTPVTPVPAPVQTRRPGSYVTVAGLPRNDTLNIRTGPSTRDPVVAAVSEGRLFKLIQCLTTGGQEWCEVEAYNSRTLRGWAAGRYLSNQ